jgi:molecular chaperone GrpE
MTDDRPGGPDEPVTPQAESDRAKRDPEPWVAKGKLRDALAEAVASYASTEATGRSATQAKAPSGGQPATSATTEADGHAAHLHAVGTQGDRYLDQLQRLKADFENYRKRVQRDNEALALRAGEGVIESLLPVLDSMRRALESAERHEEGQHIKGMQLVAGQLRAALESHGLDEVPAAPGVPFDPSLHEAVVAQESTEYAEGMISAVLEPGYLLHGRLLRPACVIVAR